MADYYFIGVDSPFHGIDRYFAMISFFQVFATSFETGKSNGGSSIAKAIIPLGFHLLARVAKHEENWGLWIFAHGFWHITGALLIWDFYNKEEIHYQTFMAAKQARKLAVYEKAIEAFTSRVSTKTNKTFKSLAAKVLHQSSSAKKGRKVEKQVTERVTTPSKSRSKSRSSSSSKPRKTTLSVVVKSATKSVTKSIAKKTVAARSKSPALRRSTRTR